MDECPGDATPDVHPSIAFGPHRDDAGRRIPAPEPVGVIHRLQASSRGSRPCPSSAAAFARAAAAISSTLTDGLARDALQLRRRRVLREQALAELLVRALVGLDVLAVDAHGLVRRRAARTAP